MKALRKAFFGLGVFVTACGVIATIVVKTVMKDWLIIGYGIRAYARMQRFSSIIIILGVLCLLCYGVFMLKWLHKQRKQEKAVRRSEQDRSQILARYAEDSLNPEYMRRRLELLGKEKHELEPLAIRCLKQMDSMDSLQDKLEDLISLNDASYLSAAVNALNSVEHDLCERFRNIINLCIAADSVATLDRTEINKNLNDNQKMLDDVKELLRTSANWVNQYNDADGDNGGKSEAERLTAAIGSLREE